MAQVSHGLWGRMASIAWAAPRLFCLLHLLASAASISHRPPACQPGSEPACRGRADHARQLHLLPRAASSLHRGGSMAAAYLGVPHPRGYVAHRAAEPPSMSGRLDDASWQAALRSEDFVDIEGSAKVGRITGWIMARSRPEACDPHPLPLFPKADPRVDSAHPS